MMLMLLPLIIITILLIGLILENRGFFAIPEDQLMRRYLKLETIRVRRKKFELYTKFRTALDDTGMYDMAYWLEDLL